MNMRSPCHFLQLNMLCMAEDGFSSRYAAKTLGKKWYNRTYFVIKGAEVEVFLAENRYAKNCVLIKEFWAVL